MPKSRKRINNGRELEAEGPPTTEVEFKVGVGVELYSYKRSAKFA